MLIISREPSSLGPLWSVSQAHSWEVDIAGSGFEALERIQSGGGADLILLDLVRADSDGFYTLRWLRRVRPDLAIVVLVRSENAQERIEAVRLGARDYMTKPLNAMQLEALVHRYAERPGNDGSSRDGLSHGMEQFAEGISFVAVSPLMRKLRTQAELLAQVDVPLLIVGESGSGKETTARLIHGLSERSRFGFHKVNCAVLLGELLEKELFGYEPDAFPGAIRSKPGKLESSDKGTIYLADIAEMPASLQVKLLHLLQEKEFFRLGGDTAINTDVRVMAAIGAHVEQALSSRKLREDLYYRLSAFTIHVPPLRQRRSEIPLLLEHFMNQLAMFYGLPARNFSRFIVEACQGYSWPGNLRELESLVKRYVVMGDEEMVLTELRRSAEIATLAAEMPGPSPIDGAESEEHLSGLRSLVQSVKGEAEKNAIAVALEQTRWNRKAAARLLKVSYRTLLYKIQQYHMSPPPSYVPTSLTGQGTKGDD